MVAFFQKITDVLNQSNIPYMLSGSVAMSIYIVPRATRDFDFIIHLEQKYIDHFVQYFQDGYYCDKDAIQDAVNRRSMFNIIDHASGFKADFVVLKDEAFRLEEFERRKKVDFFDKTIYVVSPEDLLLSKLIWIQDFQSAQQMEDIKNLSAIEQLDWPYITKWIEKLHLKSFNLFEHE
ncbi:hypothetical protein A4H97_11055 [Niastella yeongjuensis]|uniref:DUF6036 domain-containing protein n=1 Tax=Niastella yeongjuensis TaxID=354355 RepID=A0A1V9EBY6_9BACT|nr:DUF6036 family nucleotidyltransferase [Niastella yeongjuensis]OQP43445.1 hypothetical protein A4H97_11055 [Niastella yeongjuensis]SEP41598.1 hypothetical protein SAMN05660816_05888 [Niastella yeongjuensis]